MTSSEARAIVEKVEKQQEFTDRDSAVLVDLQARYVDYLDLLETDHIPVKPCLDLDKVADYVMSFMEQK